MKKIFERYEINITDEQEKKLTEYMEEILRLNESINLTAITDRDEFVERHYIDSLTIIKEKEFMEASTVIDVGTGGGFPGVPLAILAPEKNFLLLDSLEKRLRIISDLSEKIGIPNVSTLHMRAEDAGRDKNYREKFDLCVSRAVANLSTLSEYCLPLVKIGGNFAAYKSSKIQEELEEARPGIKELGGEITDLRKTETNQSLVIIKKIKATPGKYPRKAGEPKRKPLR